MRKSEPRALIKRKALLTGPIPPYTPARRAQIAAVVRARRATRALDDSGA